MRADWHDGRRWALILGHPGHELRVWSWMRTVRPRVAVITDGSGSGGHARLALTRAVCDETGSPISEFFGVATDRDVYRAILDGNVGHFLGLAERLAAMMVDGRIEAVAGDSIEGYNPTHDICRFVIDRAVRIARCTRPVDNYEFALVGSARPAGQANAIVMKLLPDEVAAKLRVCRRYAEAAGGTLFGEVAAMLKEFSPDEFALECLVPVENPRPSSPGKPFYEHYGEQQVAAGRYDRVIRRDEHMAPIERALDA